MGREPASILGRAAAIVVRLVLMVVIVAAMGVLIGAMFLPAAMVANDLVAAVRNDILDVPPLGEADTPPQNSYVFAADGSFLAELTFEENRVPVRLQDVPQVAIDAVLATEDANYYEHEGVNHLAIVRAALTNLRAGGIESGASTITQQYVKLAFLTPEQTIKRKIEEALYAIQLEDQLTKDEILERYLNRSYFGNGVYGIGTAAERYFSKDVQDLSLGEAAMLAGLLRAPEANNPINSPANAQARRDIVLTQMAAHGFVTREQAAFAIAQPLVVSISEPPPPENPFWVDWVSRLLINEDVSYALGTQVDAMETMGASFEERRRMVFQSGLRIHTTLDPTFQRMAEEAIREHLTYEDEPPEELALEPLASIVSVEPGTGAILAMAVGPQEYGSCSEDDSWVGVDDQGRLLCDRTKVNPAVPAQGSRFGRQPGSAFKPVLTAAALESGVSPGLTLDATGPQEITGCRDGDGLWTVRNTGGDGILDMYEATRRSSNVYHALLIAEVGPERVIDMSRRLGITSSDLPNECSLALGAGSVFPLEMATAYATLANRGEWCAPYPIQRIEDANGRVLWEHDPDCRQVIDTEVADRVVDLLAGPVGPGGTAPIANLGAWPTRGKTGTTSDYIDAWFVGFIRQVSTAAWIGYPNGVSRFETLTQAQEVCPRVRNDAGELVPVSQPACLETRYLSNTVIGGQSYARVFGGTIPAPMWKTYMAQVAEHYEPEGFPDPGPIPTGVVPDLLQAESIAEAEELAEEAGFRLIVEELEHWSPAGTFVEQDPEAGIRLAIGNAITLSVSDGEGEAPELPDLIGLTLDEAAEVLFEMGYRVFRRDVPVEDEDLIGLVVEMDPPAGTQLLPDDEDGVVLGIGVPAPEPEEPEEPPADGDGGGDGGDGPGQGQGPPGGVPGGGQGPGGD